MSNPPKNTLLQSVDKSRRLVGELSSKTYLSVLSLVTSKSTVG